MPVTIKPMALRYKDGNGEFQKVDCLKGDPGSIENAYATDIQMSVSDTTTIFDAVDGKAGKVAGATSGNFAALDSNGNLTDSGHKHSDYLTSHQSISGKADKVASATSGNFAALDSNGNLTDSGHKHSDYLTSHQSISGKADKVNSATNNNFAALDSSGNLKDSGKKATDFADATTTTTALNGKVTTRNSSVYTPELDGMRINNRGSNVDVLTFGGGQEYGASNNVGGIMYSHTDRIYTFRSKGPNNGNNEDFRLPAHSDGDSNKSYDILTTKDFPFVREKGASPGGTVAGDNTNYITFTAPGSGRQALIFVADKHFTLYYNEPSSTQVYTDNFMSSGWTLTKSGDTYTLTRSAVQSFAYNILWL